MRKTKWLPDKINIKWKLTLWAAFLMLFLFLSYSIFQYMMIQKWDIAQEKHTIQKKMEEVISYIHGMDAGKDISKSESYLDVLNEKYQLIRIVKENNSILFTISDEVPQSSVKPKYVSKKELYELSPSGEEDRLLVYRKHLNVNGSNYTVEIVRNMEKFNELINQIFKLIFIAAVISIIISLIGGRLLSIQLLKPVNSMIGTMKKIKEKGLTERVPLKHSKDEMNELGIMFNELMDGLEKSFLQQQQFVEDASHELKTPLSIIHGHLSLISRWGKHDPERLERSIQLSLNETNRLIQLVSDLLVLTRDQDDNQVINTLEPINIKAVIENVIENFRTINNDCKILTDIKIKGDFTLPILKRHLEQVIIILLDNAIKYSKLNKKIHFAAKMTKTNLMIEIKDFGIGIPKEDLPNILHRFYRVDKARSREYGGNGLGLSIAKRLLDLYEGTITIESMYGEWTMVTVTFPL